MFGRVSAAGAGPAANTTPRSAAREYRRAMPVAPLVRTGPDLSGIVADGSDRGTVTRSRRPSMGHSPPPTHFVGAPRPFLTARWSNLFLATYPVPDELLSPRLPPGLDLDRRDGSAFVSLVAFD